MTTNSNRSILTNIIGRRMIDMIKFCYYPFCENVNNDTDIDHHVVKLKIMSTSHIKRLLKRIQTEPKINGNYIEYGIRDTFVRSISHNATEDTRMFFRREIHTTRLENCSGIFTIELYTMCDEANFPILINYPHYLNCDVDTYVLSNTESKPLRMCFTKVTNDNELQQHEQKLKLKSKYSMPENMMYFSVCRDIAFTSIINVDVELNTFFKDIVSLTNNHRKNFVY